MISLDTLQRNIFTIVRMGRTDGIEVRFSYKRQVYLMHVQLTKERYVPVKRRGKREMDRSPILIETDNCLECRSISIGGICLNKKCDTNLQL